jgi:hypothetical protein
MPVEPRGPEEAHAAFLARLLERSASERGRVRIRELANAVRLITDRTPVYRWRGQTWPDNAQVVPFALLSVASNGDFSTTPSDESSPNLPDSLGSPARGDADHNDRRPLYGFDERCLSRLDEDRL